MPRHYSERHLARRDEPIADITPLRVYSERARHDRQKSRRIRRLETANRRG